MRRELLDLHRTLVDAERREYERARGRMSDRAFLAALINDPELAWLNPLTALVVRLDELPEEEDATLAELRKLLRPQAEGVGFQRKYDEAMQRNPEVVVAHGKAMQALSGAKSENISSR